MVLPGEAWSFSRYNEQMVQGHCGNFKTLRRMLAAVAGILDEHRTGSAERAMAMTSHLYLFSKSGLWILSTISNGHRRCWDCWTQKDVTTCNSLDSSSQVRSASTKKLPTKKQNVDPRVRPVRPCLRPFFPKLQGWKLRSELAFKASYKKQQSSREEVNESGKGRGRVKRGQASNPEA